MCLSCHISNIFWNPATTSRWGVQYVLTINSGHNFKFETVAGYSSALNKCMTSARSSNFYCTSNVVRSVDTLKPMQYYAIQYNSSAISTTTRKLMLNKRWWFNFVVFFMAVGCGVVLDYMICSCFSTLWSSNKSSIYYRTVTVQVLLLLCPPCVGDCTQEPTKMNLTRHNLFMLSKRDGFDAFPKRLEFSIINVSFPCFLCLEFEQMCSLRESGSSDALKHSLKTTGPLKIG